MACSVLLWSAVKLCGRLVTLPVVTLHVAADAAVTFPQAILLVPFNGLLLLNGAG